MNMDNPEESVRGNTMLKGPVQYCLTIQGIIFVRVRVSMP